jgi:putative component of membrane protein insertase Oxa1/YidC/SpoIIIJ protein YidD
MPQLRSLNEPSIMRKALRSPATWLALLLLFVALAVADSLRPPSRQVSVRLFTAAVTGYHHYLHPLTGHFIHCRYEPTSSRYSVEAVQKYGIAKGLALSFRRIRSCRRSVPMGTRDPVP